MDDDANRQARYKAAAKEVLSELSDDEVAQGMQYLSVLVDSWYDDAGSIDPDDLFRIGISDLHEALGNTSGSKRVQALEALALERTVEMVSSRAFRLAQGVIDETTSAKSVEGQANDIIEEINALLPSVKQLEDAALKQRLLRELSDADLECRYIKEGDPTVMSIRLNQYSDR